MKSRETSLCLEIERRKRKAKSDYVFKKFSSMARMPASKTPSRLRWKSRTAGLNEDSGRRPASPARRWPASLPLLPCQKPRTACRKISRPTGDPARLPLALSSKTSCRRWKHLAAPVRQRSFGRHSLASPPRESGRVARPAETRTARTLRAPDLVRPARSRVPPSCRRPATDPAPHDPACPGRSASKTPPRPPVGNHVQA